MRLHLTIDDLDFDDADGLLEFAAKLKTVMALPMSVLKGFAAAGVASANSPAANGMKPATVAQNARAAGDKNSVSPPAAPRADVASAPTATVSPPVAIGADEPAAAPGASELSSVRSEAEAAPIDERTAAPPATSVPVIPAAPVETAPRARRGRPAREKAAATGNDSPNTIAPIEPSQPAAAPTLTAAAIGGAVDAGKGEALALDAFQTKVTEILSDPKAGGAFMSTLTTFKGAEGKVCRGVRDVLPDERGTFLEKFAAAVKAAA